MRTLMVPQGGSLIDAILPLLESRGNDYSRNLVVFPGKRPAHFLRKALANKAKGSLIPPQILSIDELIDFIYKEKLGLSKRKLDAIDAAAILYEIHSRTPKPLGGSTTLSPDRFFPLGLKLYRDFEESIIEGVPPEKVRDIEHLAEDKMPLQTVERLQSLSLLYGHFSKKVEEMDCSTRSLRYRTIAEKIHAVDFGEFSTVMFAGFYAFTRAEKEMIGGMSVGGRVLMIFQNGPGIMEKMGELGVTDYELLDVPVNGVPKINFYRSPDTHGQVFALNNLIKEKTKSGESFDERSVMVLPTSETLFPLLHQTLSLFDTQSYNVSMGYPLHRTPIFGFINSLMQLITSMDGDRFYVPDYMKFMLHPYAKNISFKNRYDVTRIMFHTLEEEMVEKKTRSFVHLTEIESNRSLLKRVSERLDKSEGAVSVEDLEEHLKSIHENTIGRLLDLSSTGDFAGKVIEILTYIYKESTARHHALFQPFAESFIDVLRTLSRSLMKDVTFESANGYFTLMRHYLMTCHIPFEGTPLHGLQVLGALETRNVRFDTVFFLDVNEGVIPMTAREDSLLPYRARKALNLPTYYDREKLAEYYFETLIRSAKEAHLFFIETDRKEKSRFVEKLIWEQQKEQKKIEDHEYIKSIQYKINLAGCKPVPIGKTPEMVAFLKGFTYSPSALDTYLTCQLRFYFRYVLGIDPREEVTGDVERTDIGQFVHDILHDFFRNKTGRNLTKDDLDITEMDRVVDRYFTDKHGEDISGAVFLIKKQVQRRMSELLQKYYLPIIKNTTLQVLETEKRLKAEINGFKVAGRLDKVEQRGDVHVIVDYKTSANANYLNVDFDKLDLSNRDSWYESVGTVQLPLYQLLYAANTGLNLGMITSMFLLLGRTNLNSDIEVRLAADQELAGERFSVLREVLFRLLNEIVNLDVLFQPTPDDKENCPECDFKYMCGT